MSQAASWGEPPLAGLASKADAAKWPLACYPPSKSSPARTARSSQRLAPLTRQSSR
jgi:hypothetical protein